METREPIRAQRHDHIVPETWSTAPVPPVYAPSGITAAKWHVLYAAVKENSEVPLATVFSLDKDRPDQQIFALRRALQRRARREGFRLHISRQKGKLYLWLSIPAPETGAPDATQPA